MKPFSTRQIPGHGRGKFLGFPTINMTIPSSLDMETGIYAVWVSISGKTFAGALHYGPVPVFGQDEHTLEVFLLDTTGNDIEDTSKIEITPVKRLRDVRNFGTQDALVVQIRKDVEDVRRALRQPAVA